MDLDTPVNEVDLTETMSNSAFEDLEDLEYDFRSMKKRARYAKRAEWYLRFQSASVWAYCWFDQKVIVEIEMPCISLAI